MSEKNFFFVLFVLQIWTFSKNKINLLAPLVGNLACSMEKFFNLTYFFWRWKQNSIFKIYLY